MESPRKVIAAFLGVFIAGAVFGAFFTLGVGTHWMTQNTPAPVVTTPATVVPATPSTSPTTQTPAQKAAAQRQQPLLQIPQTWQAVQLMRRYADRLDLTEGQKERIDPVFQRAADDYRRVQSNTLRETGIILQRLHQDIAKELTPDQREKLDKWQEKQREMLQKVDPKQQPKKGSPKTKAGSPAQTGATPSTSGGTTTPTRTTVPSGSTGDSDS